MENLFSTSIAIQNEQVNYRVVFENEKYVFISEADNGSFPSFSFSREHDEWREHDNLPPEIKKQAIEKLDKYLLKQH